MSTDVEFHKEELNYIIKESEIIRKELVRLESYECKKTMNENMRLAAVKFQTTIFRELLRKKEIHRRLIYFKEPTVIKDDCFYF
jgi:hypothetical protein